MRPTAITIHNVSLGARGSRRNRRPTSWGSRSSLWLLHRRQAATTFSQTWRPPRERGTTWSTFSARSPQYWQTWSSQTNTARLDNPTRALKGTFTKYQKRMTLRTWSTRLAPQTKQTPNHRPSPSKQTPPPAEPAPRRSANTTHSKPVLAPPQTPATTITKHAHN